MIETDCCPKRGPNPPAGVEDYWRNIDGQRRCSFCLSLHPAYVLVALTDSDADFHLEGSGEDRQLTFRGKSAAEHIPVGHVRLIHFSNDRKAELTTILAARAELK